MRKTSYEERIAICALSRAGCSDSEIGERVGWKAATVRKWRRRGERAGSLGLVCKLGRPASGALSSFPAWVQELIQGLRQAHPGWGAKTLRTELVNDLSLHGEHLPGRSSIARWLKEKGLSGWPYAV